MMGAIRQWLLGMACAGMAGALAQALAPEGGAKRVARLAGALVLLLATVNPLLKLDGGEVAAWAEQAGSLGEGYAQALEEENDFLYAAIIEQRTAAYILDKAEQLGMDCQAEVSYEYDGQGVPYPYQAEIRGIWTQEQRSQLEQTLERELGIPLERQYYERTQG